MSTKHSIVILSKDVGAAHGYAYTCFKKYKNKSGTVAHIYNSTSQEVEIGGLLQVQGQPGLHSEFKPAWATEWQSVRKKEEKCDGEFLKEAISTKPGELGAAGLEAWLKLLLGYV